MRDPEVRGLILELVARQARGFAAGAAPGDGDDFDLLASGTLDSLGFVQLVGELERRLGCRIELDDIAPDRMTKLGDLAAYIAARPPAAKDAR